MVQQDGGRAPHALDVVRLPVDGRGWLRPQDTGMLVLDVSDAGPVHAVQGGIVPTLLVEVHRMAGEASLQIVLRFRQDVRTEPEGWRTP